MLDARLREILRFFDISISYFAKRIGISKNYAGRLVSGKSGNPNERFFSRVATEFHVNIDWLTEGKGTMFEENPDFTRGAAFLNEYYELTEDQKNAICMFIQQARHHRLYLAQINKQDKEQ